MLSGLLRVSTTELCALLRQRPALEAALAPHLARAGGEAAWGAALLGLVRANAGPACVVAGQYRGLGSLLIPGYDEAAARDDGAPFAGAGREGQGWMG